METIETVGLASFFFQSTHYDEAINVRKQCFFVKEYFPVRIF